MTDFDQPDCAFSVSRRAETTTPLQALTTLNHTFTLDMADAMAARLKREAPSDQQEQIQRAFLLCFARMPSDEELSQSEDLIDSHGLSAMCRVLLNTSELIYLL